ncbi:MAG: ferritin [Anaerovoracaceae bacterium]
MLNKEVVKLMNEQINKELYSAYLYLDIANYYEENNLDGFANWFTIQAREEKDHAMLFRQFLLSNGEKVKLEAIAAPDVPFADFKAPLTAAYEHEKFITASIEAIYDAALENKDYRSFNILNWFITEQEEEEINTDGLVQKYDLFGADGKGLYMLNSEMGARVYGPPSLVLE